jgi:hypothetical protein
LHPDEISRGTNTGTFLSVNGAAWPRPCVENDGDKEDADGILASNEELRVGNRFSPLRVLPCVSDRYLKQFRCG